ncbi:MAG: hypothetical protein ICV64_02715 [Thermoleophilia bacterium]|nr:hypothetical protein [Thermoleophilia bacterium]
MRLRSAVGVAGAVAGTGAALAARRRRGRERVELEYGDGSMVGLEAGSTAADDLLALARRAVRGARGG